MQGAVGGFLKQDGDGAGFQKMTDAAVEGGGLWRLEIAAVVCVCVQVDVAVAAPLSLVLSACPHACGWGRWVLGSQFRPAFFP